MSKKAARMDSKFYVIRTIKKRWLPGCLFLFFIACKNKPVENKICFTNEQRTNFYQRLTPVKSLIKNGDLVFRNGYDDISAAARSMNRIDTSFSHCGIALVENDSILIYHAIGGDYNPHGKLRRDPIDSFFIPEETNKLGIYRYNLLQNQEDLLCSIIRQHYKNEVRFDLLFSLATNDKMYCSEFVYKSLNQALSDSLSLLIAPRPWPIGITPDDLYLNPRSHLVKQMQIKMIHQ